MLVYVQNNYAYPNLLRQTPGFSGKWKDMQFTFDNTEQADVIVVINHPVKDIKMKCKRGARILLIQEPPYERNNYLKLHFRFYDLIVSGFPSLHDFNMLTKQAALPWHVDLTYDELLAFPPAEIDNKQNGVSFITSNSNIYPEHQTRLDFIGYLRENKFPFDLFGRGFRPIANKLEGLISYKYVIAAENYIAADYFTEKIVDAFLTFSMPIYYGCININDYFPSEAMILVDLNKPQESLEKMKEAIANKKWEKNKDAIIHARELVLNKYQFFPAMYELIRENLYGNETVPYRKVYLPHSGLTSIETYKNKLRQAFLKKRV